MSDTHPPPLLTALNFRQGFLLDEELMAGISENEGGGAPYTAFVLRHTTGETLGHRTFGTLEEALEALHAIQRPWVFEKTKECGDGSCTGGTCPAACSKKEAGCCPKDETDSA